MDKGIRQYARDLFTAQNELRRKGEAYTGPKGNTAFRKHVMAELMDQFGISLASASTHYNDAFKTLKELNAELVSGLGRPDDKKGGRKPKPALTGKEVTEGAEPPTEAVPEQTVFTVKKKSDGTVIAEGLSFEAAKELVEKAAKAKKAKLYYV